jgi:hypothetical protein
MLAKRWIAALALLGGILATGLACGPEFYPEDESLFDPRIGTSEPLSGFLFDANTHGIGHTWGFGDHFRQQNLIEWQEWLGLDSLARSQWDTIIYSSTLTRLDSLIRHIQGKGSCPPSWKDFPLLRNVPEKKLLPALRYVEFAARVEPLSTRDHDERWSGSRASTPASEPSDLYQEGLQAARKEKQPFLRQRWFFQLAKLCFYTDVEDGLNFMQEQEAELKAPSASLYWRSRMYRAGLLRQFDTASANLECARVASSFPMLAEMAANDFLVQSQKDWLRTLNRESSPKGKASLWFLAGLRSNDPAMIGEILALDSSSPYPSLLAVRHLARSEYVKDTSLASLRAIAVRIAPSRRTGSPAFWNLLAGHLTGLAGPEDRSLAFLDSAARLAGKDSVLSLQIRTSRILSRLRNARRPNPELERFLMSELPSVDSARNARWPYLDRILRNEMARIWKDSLPLALTLGDILVPDRDTLQALVDFRLAKGSAFDEFAKRRSTHSASQALEQLGCVHLYDNRYALAVATLERVAQHSSLGTDPFNAEISDGHDRDHRRFAQSAITRLDYAREISRLERQADGTGPEAAKAALRLGIGLYNRTVFGNARSLYQETGLDARNDPRIMDLGPARKRFEQAARDLPSPEGRAWATWLLAKCERDADAYGSAPKSSYALLRKQYGKTRFWKSAVKECGWLREWAAHP